MRLLELMAFKFDSKFSHNFSTVARRLIHDLHVLEKNKVASNDSFEQSQLYFHNTYFSEGKKIVATKKSVENTQKKTSQKNVIRIVCMKIIGSATSAETFLFN